MQLPTRVLLTILPAFLAASAPTDSLEKRQGSCPGIHVFGARETTVAPGFGSSITVVDDILNGYPGSTAEAIVYPACGGQASCGGDSYSQSVIAGIQAAATAVNNFNAECPETQIALVGYSQGSEIFDAALCGGGDPNQGYTNTAVLFTAAALAQIKVAIFMGDPLFKAGLSYEVGTCEAGGFDARPAGFVCPSASKIKSYCDASDPYCCNGDNAATHQGYGAEYGAQAYAFVQSKLSTTTTGSGGGTTTTPPSTGPTGTSGACSALYGQCGGIDWTGAKCCSAGTCQEANAYYSQCLT